MRKTPVVCGVFLGICSLLVSAAPAADVTGKGIKAGFSLADMNGADWDEDFRAKPGYSLGAFLTLDLAPGLSLQPEVFFVQKGSRASDGDLTMAVRLNYFEIPVLLKYALLSSPKAKVFIFAGPALAMKFDSRLYVAYEGESSTQDFGESKPFDVGLVFGGEVAVPLGRNTLLLDIRYTLGLTNCCQDGNGDRYRVKNSAILFLAGIGF
ncbi:MAG: PorT family protein [Candidatus Aminicenantes bacterium]|nr:PorT family protein [Candidatus Aminicenantes bacterium]